MMQRLDNIVLFLARSRLRDSVQHTCCFLREKLNLILFVVIGPTESYDTQFIEPR